MKIYIAGMITGNADYELNFEEAEYFIKQKGHIPLNPVKPEGFEYEEYIMMGLNELCHCDAIYMLDSWPLSKGAILELNLAELLGLTIYFEENNDL